MLNDHFPDRKHVGVREIEPSRLGMLTDVANDFIILTLSAFSGLLRLQVAETLAMPIGAGTPRRFTVNIPCADASRCL